MLAALVGRRALPAPSSDIPLRGTPPLPARVPGDPTDRLMAFPLIFAGIYKRLRAEQGTLPVARTGPTLDRASKPERFPPGNTSAYSARDPLPLHNPALDVALAKARNPLDLDNFSARQQQDEQNRIRRQRPYVHV